MSDRTRYDGRGRILAAAAVVLAVVGVVVLALALRAPAAPAAPPRSADDVVAAPLPSSAPAAPTPTRAPDVAVPGDGPTAALPGPSAEPVTAAVPVPELGPVLPASDPVGLTIPSIGVASTVLQPLSLDAQGVLPAPTDYALPGWYTGGPNPGQLGPAVIAGHVDGPDGPAVFYRLGELVPGATVEVARADGTVAVFVVDGVERYAKADFPTSRVYGNTTDRAEIRLITCGGAFDRTTGHYVDNVVVFGHLAA